MSKANFDIVVFNEHIGDKEEVLEAQWYPFVGGKTTVKRFNIPGVPKGLGYIMLQVYDVQSMDHKIFINGENLSGVDIIRTRERRWQDVTDIIPEGLLKKGENTIHIECSDTGDNILIGAAMIHWKEHD